jgi:DHA1 family vesicular acetylcholine transporter-like MFS transporter 3
MIWLPSFLPHVGGVIFTVKMQAKFPEYIWAVAAAGVVLDGASCILLPWCTNYFMLMLPICILCFGIALVDTALLPTLGYIVDKVRFVMLLVTCGCQRDEIHQFYLISYMESY